MNLFDYVREKLTESEQPLAARMRPRTLDDFVGQEHILAPGRLLRRAIQADQLSSLIFYGPPGTGKTTLASVIANTTKSHFEVLNAVLSGVKDIREVVEQAQVRRGEFGTRTILFVDEVHRWNKAQQDALLPWVENGTVVLIGATTENPYFSVNQALVSRSRIFQLKALSDDDLLEIAERTLKDEEHGYGKLNVNLAEDARRHLVQIANGDARGLLNALELAVETTEPDADGVIHIDISVAEESIQRRAVLYDKEGDYHFDTISAFIKSLRGSDPDAAMYWLAKMVYAGEDPRFLFRRMLIFCGEDIGLADPNALVVTTAAAEAFERVGMPEGRYHLGMAALYLATAPKSNSVFAFFDALASVEKEHEGEVPSHLRDASRDKKGFGHGEGYLYPHAYRDHWVAQQYLPDSLKGRIFYQPGSLGYEKEIAVEVQQRREAQMAAVFDSDTTGAPPEILTFSPVEHDLERWLTRTMSGISANLEEVRKRVYDPLVCPRHARVLDIHADNGLLMWEALRRVPEGGVWALVSNEQTADALRQQTEQFPVLRQPQIICGQSSKLPEIMKEENLQDMQFDIVVGRNLIRHSQEHAPVLRAVAEAMADAGQLSLAETIPKRTQRLYKLVRLDALPAKLAQRLVQAEEAIYNSSDDLLVNWDIVELKNWLASVGFVDVNLTEDKQNIQQEISKRRIGRWFSQSTETGRRSYGERLADYLSAAEVEQVQDVYTAQLLGKTINWTSELVYVYARCSKTE